MSRMVRTLAVTSSPTMPSPRVAPRTSKPVLVAQRAGQPVDLGLGHEVERRIGREIEEAADARHELVHLLRRHRVVEREHRHGVDDLAERLDRLRHRPAGSGCRRGSARGSAAPARCCAGAARRTRRRRPPAHRAGSRGGRAARSRPRATPARAAASVSATAPRPDCSKRGGPPHRSRRPASGCRPRPGRHR